MDKNQKRKLRTLWWMLQAVLLTIFITTASSAYSRPSTNPPARNIKLPALFSDNMVVQRNRQIPVWGTAEPGGKIEVVFKDNRERTIADKDGKWRVFLKPEPAGGPYKLMVIGEDTTTFQNVLSGEVWVASGQSNMEMPLAGWGKIKNFKQEIAQANYPDIRFLQVTHETSTVPRSDVTVEGGQWQEVSSQTIPNFSAVAYFFGRNLYQNLNIPIGLIHTSWGGTVAEAWTSGTSLKAMPDFAGAVHNIEQGPKTKAELLNDYRQEMKKWEGKIRKKDPGYKKSKAIWAGTDYDDSEWNTMLIPALWEKEVLPGFDGIVWFRKTIEIPENWKGQKLTLSLGPVDDDDITWFNGQKIGQTSGWNQPRAYTIPGNLVKAGKNVITIRVVDTGGGGGIYGNPDALSIAKALDKQASVRLGGAWKFKAGLDLGKIPPAPASPDTPNRPTVLYNAMIHPLIPYAMRGVIWYQGESNAGRAKQYQTLFPLMINDWRRHWGEGNFPFLFVQLANYMARKDQPGESDWAELREAQLKTLSLPYTGMAVAIDIGESGDIHPKNKQEVGRRLALIARAQVYGEQIPFSGPIYHSMKKVEGDKIRLTFDYVDGGLKAEGADELKGFAIAGSDHKFHWAEARIVGDQVVVWSPAVPDPVAVRYAWAANPECNLYNKAGLPASPFRTDNW